MRWRKSAMVAVSARCMLSAAPSRSSTAGSVGAERGVAKVQLGVGEGRNKSDKRQAVAARDWQRDKARLMRDRG